MHDTSIHPAILQWLVRADNVQLKYDDTSPVEYG